MSQRKSTWNDWKLFTKNGRQVWAYKSTSQNIDEHLNNVQNFSEQDKQAFAQDFSFDRLLNPSSSDKVFREQALKNNDSSYNGEIPQTKNEEEQAISDSLIKGMHYFSQLQSEEGHWAGDYGGPLFLLPGLLIASYISETPFPKPHQEMMKIYLFNHQHTDGGWGMHIEGKPTMFGTVMQYVSLRLLGVGKDDARQAFLPGGNFTYQYLIYITGMVLTACSRKCGYFLNGCPYILHVTGVIVVWCIYPWLIAMRSAYKCQKMI
jgi:lanosterol synthase